MTVKAEGGRRKAEGFASNSRRATPRRSAVTLFELLLVLVLLVVIGSLAAPLLEGSFSSIRLKRGTDQVLAAWSQARTHAIEAGRIFQFRFQADGNQFRVDPWLGGLDAAAEEANALETDVVAIGESSAETEMSNWTYTENLPEQVVFNAAESIATDELGERSVTPLGAGSSTEWSAPILFYPDGTTSEASLLLKNDKGLFRRATLRALTGVARISDLLTKDEVERMRSH